MSAAVSGGAQNCDDGRVTEWLCCAMSGYHWE